VIKPPHALGFFDPDLPALKAQSQQKPGASWNVKRARLEGDIN